MFPLPLEIREESADGRTGAETDRSHDDSGRRCFYRGCAAQILNSHRRSSIALGEAGSG